MMKEDVLNSVLLKKRFCKNFNVPINLFENPYFMQRLETLDPIYGGLLDKFDAFAESMKDFRSDQDYLEYYNSVKDRIIDDIKSKPGFQRFQECEFLYCEQDNTLHADNICFHAEPWSKSKQTNLYSELNTGKSFLSIDMKKANFTALRAYDPDIFHNCSTWEEYLQEFTNSISITDSKYVRQVVLGACNPKRQVKFEQWLMLNALYVLYSHGFPRYNTDDIRLFSLTGDEIILRDTGIDPERIENVLKEQAAVGGSLHVERFTLEKVPKTGVYMRRHDDESTVFKCLDSETGHQILKYYQNLPVTEDDLVFRHPNGQLAKFLNPLPNPWA